MTLSGKEGILVKKAFTVALLTILTGCRAVSPSAPSRFPQFSEHLIAGPGIYRLPQWSADSRYLAFIDVSRDSTLMIYDSEAKTSWNVAVDISNIHFSWGPNNTLTYLKYRPDLSGSPYPNISELHQVDLHGENDEIIATNLSSAGDFDWFSNEERIAILLTKSDLRGYFNDVYNLNIETGAIDILLESKSIGLDYIVMLALSPDEKSILVYGVHEENGPLSAQIVNYDLEKQSIRNRIFPSATIPHGSSAYPWPGIGDDTNFGWVGGNRWFLASTSTPSGNCYNYALFFFDLSNLQDSFCIPTIEGAFTSPTISPDLSKISYITVMGISKYYLMIGNVTIDLLEKLDVMPSS